VPNKVVDLFNRVAVSYDEVVPFFAAFGERIADVLAFTPGCRVLDVGAGRGAVAGQAFRRGCAVTAIDAAGAMLARLVHNWTGVNAAVMDAHRLGFADASFDVVVSSFVVHLLDQPLVALREALRVLRPCGLVAFTTPGLPPGVDGATYAAPLGDPLPALFAEFSQRLPSGGGIGQALDAPLVLDAAGFRDIEVRPVQVDLPVLDGHTYWQWCLSHGSLAFLEDLPTDHREEFRRRLIDAAEALPQLRLRRTASVWIGRKP
jgi:ubiquinone/menaquinone biosynthesis C-methylase UbiE